MYTIVDWEELYEHVRSGREQLRKMKWVAVVVKLDGPNYRWLVSQKNGLAAFGCFIALLEVCGSGKPYRNGDLKSSTGRPLDLDDLERVTGIKKPEIVTSLEFLTSDRLGWVADGDHAVTTRTPDGNHTDATGKPDGTSTLQNTTLQDKTKEDSKRRSFLFDELWKDYPRKDGKIAAIGHFNASVKTEQDEVDIRSALMNYKAEKVGVERDYLKAGGTWFYNWRDFIEVDPLIEHAKVTAEYAAEREQPKKLSPEQIAAAKADAEALQKAHDEKAEKTTAEMRKRIEDGTASKMDIYLIEVLDRVEADGDADGEPLEDG